MNKAMMVGILGLAATVTVTACGTTSPQPTTSPSGTTTTNVTKNTTPAATSSTPKAVNVNLKIETGKMDGKAGWPTFSPTTVNLPANSTVHVTIEEYDDGSAGIPQGYNNVKGTVNGIITVDGKTVASVSAKNVAHTLTIPSIGLNVPIPPRTASEKYSTITFDFKTPATAQHLSWQ